MPRTFLQMYYVARPIDCGAGLLRCLSALEEAAFSAPRNGLCELREPSAASGGRSEAEAQCARELQEAALALVKNPAEGGGGWARSALKERGPGAFGPGPRSFVWRPPPRISLPALPRPLRDRRIALGRPLPPARALPLGRGAAAAFESQGPGPRTSPLPGSARQRAGGLRPPAAAPPAPAPLRKAGP